MDLQKRKPNRLAEYDYSSPGAYFVTICTYNKQHLFGKIESGTMRLNVLGEIVNQELQEIELHYRNVQIDKYVIMPNHIHMIVVISETGGMNPSPTIKFDVSNVIGKFKASVTRSVGNAFMHSVKKPIWQRSFHDHIIRGEADYAKIWEYIDTNPAKWESDCFYNN